MSVEPPVLPIRLSDEHRTATWNPALTRSGHVLVRVRRADGAVELRRSLNSGRVRVRDHEQIESISPVES